MDTVFYLIQYARLTDFGLQIQPLAAAYDIIKTQWFKSSFSISKGKYIDDSNFEPIIRNLLPNIKEQLNMNKYSDSIINRIRSANQISFSQKDSIFFEELDIEYGEIEKFAWKSRNSVVHGGISNNIAKLTFMNRAYHTLINRVILHLLGIKEYIDYTTNNKSIRGTKIKLQGYNNDGTLPNF